MQIVNFLGILSRKWARYVPTLGYLIEVTPRLFICWKKSYLHSLIRYPTIINFEDFPPKMVIFHKKWLNFEKNPTSIILLHTPCLFHILHLSDSTHIQYPTSIRYLRVYTYYLNSDLLRQYLILQSNKGNPILFLTQSHVAHEC